MSTPADRVEQLVLSVNELSRQPGTSRRQHLIFDAPTDLGGEVAAIPPGSPVDLELLLEAVMEGVLASGEIATEAKGLCVRCLTPVQWPIEVSFQELFSYPERAQAAAEAGQDRQDISEVVAEAIDLNGPVRDALVLALPFQPLCEPSCRGLCPTCGEMQTGELDHQHDQIDPRWSILEELLQTQVEES